MKRELLIFAFSIPLLACRREAVIESNPRPAEVVEAVGLTVPLVDHHQHLLSSTAAKLEPVNPPLLAEIELPEEWSDLLLQRAERWSDPEALSSLYVQDGLVLTGEGAGWVQGGRDGAEYLSSKFARAYHLTPVAFRMSDSVGQIGGYYTRGEGTTAQHFGYFHLSLVRRGGDPTWRIAAESPVFPGPVVEEPLEAEGIVQMLDNAGIERAVVVSNAYYFDSPFLGPRARYAEVRDENDWTAQQVSKFPDRLIAFCSFNPLEDHALVELERCSRNPVFKGLKLHFGGSGVDLRDTEHRERVHQIFAAANAYRLPVMAHLQSGNDYGAEHADLFLNHVLSAAPDVPVVVAHLWGGGQFSDEALGVFADAVSNDHPATKNLYFEVAQASMAAGRSTATLQAIAKRIRQIGIDRIFYGSDGPQFGGLEPRWAWADFRGKVPLTDAEFRRIASNVAPYAR